MDDVTQQVCEHVDTGLDELCNMVAVYASELYYHCQQNNIAAAVDISSIEDETRLQKIAELADWVDPNPGAAGSKKQQLATMGAPALLSGGPAEQVAALREENRMMQERFQAMQKQVRLFLIFAGMSFLSGESKTAKLA